MPRKKRIIVPGYAHHVTQRGNYRQFVFEERRDYKKYCEWMNEYCREYKLDVIAYCLMGNHIHFIVVPENRESLIRVFNVMNMRYAQYWNRKKSNIGHLWQGRYFSCLLSTGHLYKAVRYVENNPVRAKMVTKPWEYIWSSCRARIGKEKNSLITLSSKIDVLGIYGRAKSWKDYLLENDQPFDEEIRLKTSKGLALGSKDFIKKLEKRLERNLTRIGLGRPKKGS